MQDHCIERQKVNMGSSIDRLRQRETLSGSRISPYLTNNALSSCVPRHLMEKIQSVWGKLRTWDIVGGYRELEVAFWELCPSSVQVRCSIVINVISVVHYLAS